MSRLSVNGKLVRSLQLNDLKTLVILLMSKDDLESALDASNLTWTDPIKCSHFLRYFVALIAKELAESQPSSPSRSTKRRHQIDDSSSDSESGSDLTSISNSRYKLPGEHSHNLGFKIVYYYLFYFPGFLTFFWFLSGYWFGILLFSTCRQRYRTIQI